jgi:UDP-N-acetylmuramoyl-tripeptide--D-alanyl-D-alanine ligase
MKELGETSIQEHQQLITQLQKHHWEEVIIVGGDFEHCQHNYHYFATAMDARQWIQAKNYTNRSILIKGSRGIQMEQILENK